MRRSLTAALAAFVPIAAVPLVSEARPRPVPAYAAAPAVTVDVSRLRALGLGPTADIIQSALASELRAFGPPGGGRIVVRLTGLSLNAYAGDNDGGGGSGGQGSGSGSGSNNDYLEGEILVIGPRGEVISQRPQIAVLPANSGGAYYQPGAEQRRVVNIAHQFAAWIIRQGG